MQWTADRNAGFSRANPARLYSPVIMDPVYGYEAINVEAQVSDSSSLLHWMRNMIALRKLFRVFGRGTMEILEPDNRKVLAYVRRSESEQVLCVANLSRFAQPVELDLSAMAGMTPVEMLGFTEFPPHWPGAVPPHPGTLRLLLVRIAGFFNRAARVTERDPESAAMRPGPESLEKVLRFGMVPNPVRQVRNSPHRAK